MSQWRTEGCNVLSETGDVIGECDSPETALEAVEGHNSNRILHSLPVTGDIVRAVCANDLAIAKVRK